MRKLLCATDLSMRAERAVRRAAGLAQQHGAELLLLHVVDDDQPHHIIEARQAEARAHLESGAAALPGGRDSIAAIEVVAGNAFEAIARYALEWNAELIVMGAHRRRALVDVFVGSTLERVLRADGVPVLVVNTGEHGPYRDVLLALDISPASTRAVQAARSLGLLDGGISVVHAYDAAFTGMLEGSGASPDEARAYSEAWEREARARLRAFLAANDLADHRIELTIDSGSPYDAIHHAVAQQAPQLLVVGTRGLTGLKRVFLGSVADRVLREIECDILAVPPPRTARR